MEAVQLYAVSSSMLLAGSFTKKLTRGLCSTTSKRQKITKSGFLEVRASQQRFATWQAH